MACLLGFVKFAEATGRHVYIPVPMDPILLLIQDGTGVMVDASHILGRNVCIWKVVPYLDEKLGEN